MTDRARIANNQAHFDLSMRADLIASSRIVYAGSTAAAQRLPAGFDEVDIATLEWIAAEVVSARASVASTRALTTSAGRPPQQTLQLSRVTGDTIRAG